MNKEYKSLIELNPKEIKDKDIIIITTVHSKVNYDFFVKHARAVFDTNNVIKGKKENVEKL